MLTPRTTRQGLRSISYTLHVPPGWLVPGTGPFPMNIAPRLWNSLLENLRQLHHITFFRQKLITHSGLILLWGQQRRACMPHGHCLGALEMLLKYNFLIGSLFQGENALVPLPFKNRPAHLFMLAFPTIGKYFNLISTRP